MSVLCRIEPDALEGPNAFVIRLAQANRLSPQQVHEMELLASWPTMQALLESVLPLRRKSAAYCPSCLRRDGFGRLGWELAFADACAACGHWLVDTCRDCGELVSWKRASMRSCDCGGDLLDQSAPQAPDSLVQLSRAFERAFVCSGPSLCGGLNALQPHQLRDLIRLLGSYGVVDKMARPQKRAYSASLEASWSASTVAAEVLASWPSGFELYLGQKAARAETTADSGSLQRVFGVFRRALYQGLSDAAFDFVRAAFESYLLHRWNGALDLRNKRVGAASLRQAKWEPASRARSRHRISEARMSTLIASGQVRVARRTTPAGRTFTWVHRDDLAALAPGLADELTLEKAAAELGLKRKRLAAMLPHICPAAIQAVDGRSPWAIPRSWLDSWQSQLRELPLAVPSPQTESLARLLRFRSWTPVQTSRFFLDVASGSIRAVGRLDGVVGLGAMLFDVAALEAWPGAAQAPGGVMTVPEAARRLGVKQEVAYTLVRAGLLQSTARRNGTRRWASISDAQLQRFSAEYVWGRDVASHLRTSPKAAAGLLRDLGVPQASGPSVDRGRQLLYRRSDVMRVIHGYDGYVDAKGCDERKR